MGKKLASSLLALSLGLFSIVGPQQSFAAGVVGNGTAASCTEAALDTAIAAGGAITFNCGAAPVTIAITSSKSIGKTTSIDGGNLISISGGNTGPYISVTSAGTLSLSNITLRDASPANEFNVGSTMYNAGTTTVTNVKFINNNRKALFNQGGTLTVDQSYFEDNTTSGIGAAIGNESEGELLVRDSTFVNNRAPISQSAGAIYNGGNGTTPTRVTIMRSVFTGNSAGGGGAIANFGTMSIADSTFTGNSATEGGAIQARSQAIIEVVNTTISGNTANRGGGIEVMGPIAGNAATLRNVTLSNNTAPASGSNAGGGNIAVVGNANLTLQNTIVANPGGGSANCVTQSTGGTLVDGGNNIQYPGATCLAITTVDPKLSALADNGGWTQTHAIAADSPARNAGALPACPAFDQRGVIRPQGVPCDIGAFEYGAVPTITSFSVPCAPASGAAFTLVVTGTNFIPGAKGSKLVVNGTPLATTYLSGTQLRAVVPAGIGGAGRTPLEIAVTTPTVDGGTATRQQVVCLAVYLPSVTN